MAEEKCPNISRCPIFPLVSGRTSLQVMKIQYCEGRFSRCARFRSMEKGSPPARTLLPDGTHVEGSDPGLE